MSQYYTNILNLIDSIPKRLYQNNKIISNEQIYSDSKTIPDETELLDVIYKFADDHVNHKEEGEINENIKYNIKPGFKNVAIKNNKLVIENVTIDPGFNRIRSGTTLTSCSGHLLIFYCPHSNISISTQIFSYEDSSELIIGVYNHTDEQIVTTIICRPYILHEPYYERNLPCIDYDVEGVFKLAAKEKNKSFMELAENFPKENIIFFIPKRKHMSLLPISHPMIMQNGTIQYNGHIAKTKNIPIDSSYFNIISCESIYIPKLELQNNIIEPDMRIINGAYAFLPNYKEIKKMANNIKTIDELEAKNINTIEKKWNAAKIKTALISSGKYTADDIKNWSLSRLISAMTDNLKGFPKRIKKNTHEEKLFKSLEPFRFPEMAEKEMNIEDYLSSYIK